METVTDPQTTGRLPGAIYPDQKIHELVAEVRGTAHPSLFPDLPEQAVPLFRQTDEHVLEPCSRCGGSGREENPHPRGSYRYMTWEPTCVRCGGAGARLIHVGRFVDV